MNPPVAPPTASPVVPPVAAPVAQPRAAAPVTASPPATPTTVSLIINVVVTDTTTLNNTESIKQAILAALPGVNPDNVIVRIVRVAKKRATYQILVDILGTTTLDVSAALNSTSASALDAIKNQVATLPGVTSVPGISFTVAGGASPSSTPAAQPSPVAAAPKVTAVSSAPISAVHTTFIAFSMTMAALSSLIL